jgi:hypothetical protein
MDLGQVADLGCDIAAATHAQPPGKTARFRPVGWPWPRAVPLASQSARVSRMCFVTSTRSRRACSDSPLGRYPQSAGEAQRGMVEVIAACRLQRPEGQREHRPAHLLFPHMTGTRPPVVLDCLRRPVVSG